MSRLSSSSSGTGSVSADNTMTLHYIHKNDLYVTRVERKFAWKPQLVWDVLPTGEERQFYIWLEHYLQKDIFYNKPNQQLSSPLVRRFIKI